MPPLFKEMQPIEKKWYSVSLVAEDFTEGYVQLTERDAKLVAWATSPVNWRAVEQRPWSGMFLIDIEHPLDKLPQ